MKKILGHTLIRRISDVLLSPLTLLSAVWFKYIRTATVTKMPVSEFIFMKTGLLPVNDHYYQPLINPSKHLSRPLEEDRYLPGINWNISEQLALLKEFNYVSELNAIPRKQKQGAALHYFYGNPSFCTGDAEYLYNIVRHFKPKRIIEIGCGFSTLMAVEATKMNMEQDKGYSCTHICIEPYEMPWLEQLKVEVIRKKVEAVEKRVFEQLASNDILFIDSSHMIRPQGDVLFEILEILPQLNPGVLVHVHDIFSPKDYPKEWIVEKHCFWNEQYILEAFLSQNDQFRIVGALNFLKHQYSTEFASACPNSNAITGDEPGSFWMIRN